MSEDEKQKFGDAMVWIMRGLTALGGLFFIRTFDVTTMYDESGNGNDFTLVNMDTSNYITP